jgi:hypothetical protein
MCPDGPSGAAIERIGDLPRDQSVITSETAHDAMHCHDISWLYPVGYGRKVTGDEPNPRCMTAPLGFSAGGLDI